MEIGTPVIGSSLQGEKMHGRYLMHARTETVKTLNRTDVAAGVPNPRIFTATRVFGNILFLHKGRLFQQERNMAFIFPDFRVLLGNPIEGLDVIDGQPIGIETLVERAMNEQRVAQGGTDGTAVEVTVEAPVPTARGTAKA